MTSCFMDPPEFPADLPLLGKPFCLAQTLCLPVTSHHQGPEGSFQTWHDLEFKGQQARSLGHKYLPTRSSLRAQGGPRSEAGRDTCKPLTNQLPLGPPCHRALLGVAAASAAPSGGRDKLRSKSGQEWGLVWEGVWVGAGRANLAFSRAVGRALCFP